MSKPISLQQAIEMTSLYRKEKENILDPGFKGRNILVNSETFDRADIDALLAEPDCKSIRVYYGMDDLFQVHAIIVGVNSNDEDILPSIEIASKSTDTPDSGGYAIEEGIRCPPACPKPSSLNGG